MLKALCDCTNTTEQRNNKLKKSHKHKLLNLNLVFQLFKNIFYPAITASHQQYTFINTA